MPMPRCSTNQSLKKSLKKSNILLAWKSARWDNSSISHYDRGQAVSANDDNQSNCSFESRQLCNSSLILYESNVWVRETSGGGLELLCAGGVWGCRWGWEEELCSSGDVEGLDAVFAAARLLPPLKEGEGLGFAGREGLYSWVAQDSWGQLDRFGDDRVATLKLKPGRRQWRKRGAVSPCAVSLGQGNRLRKASWFR